MESGSIHFPADYPAQHPDWFRPVSEDEHKQQCEASLKAAAEERGYTYEQVIAAMDAVIMDSIQNPALKKVVIITSPVTDRYVRPGMIALLNQQQTRIRIGGVWFDFDSRWVVE